MSRGVRARSELQVASPPAPRKPTIIVSDEVKRVYKTINAKTGSVGGYGHDGPVYGEITMGSMQKIINFLKESCNFDDSSMFLDVGAGLGKPNFHAAVDPGVRASVGVEVEHLRWLLSLQNLRGLLTKGQLSNNNTCMLQQDVQMIGSFNPMTHVYMFDVGFPPQCFVSIANAFNRSNTVQHLISFHPPRDIIKKYGFLVKLVDGLQTSMAGSSESHKVYIYKSTLNCATEATEEEAIPTEDTDGTQRHHQLQIPNLFKSVSSRKAGAEQQVSKKRKLADDLVDDSVGRKEVVKRTSKRGGKQASSNVDDIDTTFKDGLALLSVDARDKHLAWLGTTVDDFFCGGRSNRREAPR